MSIWVNAPKTADRTTAALQRSGPIEEFGDVTTSNGHASRYAQTIMQLSIWGVGSLYLRGWVIVPLWLNCCVRSMLHHYMAAR